MSTMSSNAPTSSTPTGDSSQITVCYNWTVPSETIKSCLYDDDIYYEYDDYQDDVKIESPAFGPENEQDKFVLKLYPRSTEGCSDVGSLVLQLKHEDELRVERFKVSISSFSKQEEQYIDGKLVISSAGCFSELWECQCCALLFFRNLPKIDRDSVAKSGMAEHVCLERVYPSIHQFDHLL